MSWTAYVSLLGCYILKNPVLDGLKCLLIHSQFSLEDRSSIFVHDSYEGPRGIVFLVFLVPGDSKCLWYYGSITIITSCFLWSILSHMLLRNSLLWSNNKELLWFFSPFKTWIHCSKLLVSIFEAKESVFNKNTLKLLAGYSNGCHPELLQGLQGCC